MNHLKKLMLILSFCIFCTNLFAQEKPPCSFIPEINQKSIDNLALSDYFYDNNSKLYYRIINDKNSLGILIKADKEFSRELFFRGLEVWINKGNKKKKLNGIKFPIPQMPSFDQEGIKDPRDKPEIELQSSEMEITGFGSDKVHIIPSENNNNISGEIGIDGKDMIDYQIIVPLNKFKNAIEIEKPFSIFINLGEFQRPENGHQMGDGPPQRSGMGNGQMHHQGGMPGSNKMQGGEPGMRNNKKEIEIAVKNIIIKTQ